MVLELYTLDQINQLLAPYQLEPQQESLSVNRLALRSVCTRDNWRVIGD